MIFFSDVDAAAHAGAIDASRAFALVLALAGDKDRHVVEQLLPPLRFLRRRAILPDDALAKYGAFVRDGFSKRAHALGLAEKKGESDDTRILRLALLRVVGDEGGDLQLRADAQKLALKWIADRKAVQPELASTALYLAALDADEPLWDRLHEVIKGEKDRVDRQRLIDALGSVRDPELAKRNFALFLTDELEAREATPLLWNATSDARTREALWDFVQHNFDAIAARLPRDYAAGMPGAGGSFCDEDHATALGAFFRTKLKDHPGMDRHLAQAMESVRQCAAFKAKQGPALAAFFKGR
jgi:alanyl aminopeptidase